MTTFPGSSSKCVILAVLMLSLEDRIKNELDGGNETKDSTTGKNNKQQAVADIRVVLAAFIIRSHGMVSMSGQRCSDRLSRYFFDLCEGT